MTVENSTGYSQEEAFHIVVDLLKEAGSHPDPEVSQKKQAFLIRLIKNLWPDKIKRDDSVEEETGVNSTSDL